MSLFTFDEACVVVPYVSMAADQNPNVRDNVSQVEVYLRSAVVTFASLRRFNPSLVLALATNTTPAEPFRTQLSTLGVKVLLIDFEHAPPVGFAESFMGSLFLLDVIGRVDASPLVIVDPDVLCVDSMNGLLNGDAASVSAIAMNYAPERNVNGVSIRQSDEIRASMGMAGTVSTHWGGEMYCFPAQILDAVRSIESEVWQENLTRFESGLSYLRTEEHVLNVVLAQLPTRNAGEYAKRIWTAHSHRTVSGDERGLILWHLPAEKERGLARLHLPAASRDSWFWTSDRDQFVSLAGRECSLWRRPLWRWLLDSVARVLVRLRKSTSALKPHGHRRVA